MSKPNKIIELYKAKGFELLDFAILHHDQVTIAGNPAAELPWFWGKNSDLIIINLTKGGIETLAEMGIIDPTIPIKTTPLASIENHEETIYDGTLLGRFQQGVLEIVVIWDDGNISRSYHTGATATPTERATPELLNQIK